MEVSFSEADIKRPLVLRARRAKQVTVPSSATYLGFHRLVHIFARSEERKVI